MKMKWEEFLLPLITMRLTVRAAQIAKMSAAGDIVVDVPLALRQTPVQDFCLREQTETIVLVSVPMAPQIVTTI